MDINATPIAGSGEQTLLAALQQMQQLQQQPVIPDDPLVQLGNMLSGFAAGTQGKPNPVYGMYADRRKTAVQGLQAQASIGSALGSLEQSRATAARTSSDKALDRQFQSMKFQTEQTQKRKDAAVTIGRDLAKSDDPTYRLRGLKTLQDQGFIPPDEDVEAMASNPYYGFGNDDVGKHAADIYAEALQQGKPMTRTQAREQAFQSRQTKSTVDVLASTYEQHGLGKGEARLTAERDVATAKHAPPTSLEERIAQLQAAGKTEEAQRVMTVATRLAEARSAKITMPRNLDPRFVEEAQNLRFRARELANVLEGFDPGFVGIVGQLKGISTKFSDFPGIPAFKDREKYVARLLTLTQTIKKDMLGSARTPPELKDLARSLPDPGDTLSVAQFTSVLESFTEGFVSYLHTFPETLRMAGYDPISLNKEIQGLQKGIQKLTPANMERYISRDEYNILLKKGFTPDRIRQEGYQLRERR